MKYLIILIILCASGLHSEELKRFVGSSEAGKTDPMLWMIINQLQASQTKMFNLEQKIETKMSKLGDKLDATMNKLRDKDDKLGEKITDMAKMIWRNKKLEKLGKQLSDVETKLNAHSGNITDLKNDIMIIKKDMNKRCIHGWKWFNNHCYMFRYDKLTWQQAKKECENNLAYLVKIETSTENKWIQKTMTAPESKGHTQLWTGLNDRSREGHYVWVNDNSSVGYSNWSSGEPNNNGEPENCGSIYFYGNWNDSPCSQRYGYICEK